MNTDTYWIGIKDGAAAAAKYRGIKIDFYDNNFFDAGIMNTNINAAVASSTPGTS